jgi:flavin-dependent dehydrogenase
LDPASGSGIADALWMGNLAGEAVAHCLRSPAKATLAAALYHDRVMLHFKRRVQGLRQLYQSNGFTGFAQRAV